jgi:type IV pilus assembly protein PilA
MSKFNLPAIDAAIRQFEKARAEWRWNRHMRTMAQLRQRAEQREAYVRNAQRGFTILELLIAVGIVAILFAIAVPAYQSYTTRAAASEGLQVADSMKTAVAEAFNSTGTFPADNGALGTTDQTGKYVSASGVLNGSIEVTYSATAPGALANTMVVFTPYMIPGGTLGWTCGYATPQVGWTVAPGAPVSAAATTVPSPFLPATCRTNG